MMRRERLRLAGSNANDAVDMTKRSTPRRRRSHDSLLLRRQNPCFGFERRSNQCAESDSEVAMNIKWIEQYDVIAANSRAATA